MKEYLTKKYQTAKQFSVFGAGDEEEKYYARLDANATRLGDAFARLTPPQSAHLRMSTANLEALDLISDGPIEGFLIHRARVVILWRRLFMMILPLQNL